MRFLSLNEKLRLCTKLDNLSSLALLSIDSLSALVGRPIRSRSWDGGEAALKGERASMLCARYGIEILGFNDSRYPSLLREIYDPPFVLFARGALPLLHMPCLSVVGTRNPSREGIEAAFLFSKEAAGDGAAIVSGLAFGIDAAAHSGALSAGGSTIAVLACGVDTVQPRAHLSLARRLLDSGGLLISEYAPGTAAEKWRFPERNRIIAGLSKALVVIEAPAASGALITADFALEQGREVFFHCAAFSEEARLRSRQAAAGIRKKTPRTADGYVSEGACVISSYTDFCLRMRQ